MRRKQIVYTFAVFLTVQVSLSVGNVLYTNHVSQQMCGLLVPLDDAYQKTTPTTELGRNIAHAMHEVRTAYDC